MAEGGFDYIEMQKMGEKYPEYNNMRVDDLNGQYNLLDEHESIINSEILKENFSNHVELTDINNRKRYIDNLRVNQMDKSFKDNNDDKT